MKGRSNGLVVVQGGKVFKYCNVQGENNRQREGKGRLSLTS